MRVPAATVTDSDFAGRVLAATMKASARDRLVSSTTSTQPAISGSGRLASGTISRSTPASPSATPPTLTQRNRSIATISAKA